ncbi:MAG: ABA4-like family protein [Bacteroidota bacterium]
MDKELIFSLCMGFAMVGWLLLLVAPKWKHTRNIVIGGAITLLISGVYLVVVLTTIRSGNEGGFSSLADVAVLFQNPAALLAGWVHYLALDLFVGCWMTANAQKWGIHHGFLVPCLLLTLLYGPIGVLLYFVVRAVVTKRVWGFENFSSGK